MIGALLTGIGSIPAGSSGKDVRENISGQKRVRGSGESWADVAGQHDIDEKSSSSSSSSSTSTNRPIQPHFGFQPTLVGLVGQTPQQQFAARNAEMLVKGFTISPITGQTFRLTPARERKQQFVDLLKEYDSKRSELIAYCRRIGYVFDLKTKRTLDSKGQVVDTTKDAEFTRLRKANEFAKTAIKSYKQLHPAEFAPVERKRRRNVEALVRASNRRLARLTSRQVLAPLVNTTVQPVQLTAATSAVPTVSSASAATGSSAPVADLATLLANLTQQVSNLNARFNDVESRLEVRIHQVVQELGQEAEMTSESGND